VVIIRQGALLLLALLLGLGAHAQGTAPGRPEAKTDPKAEEAAAAMERAKRLAAGPMRVILEASKGKRPTAETPVAAVAASAAATAPEPVGASMQSTLGAGALIPSAAAPVPAIERWTAALHTAPAALPALPAPLPGLSVPAGTQAKPKLVSRVDPELSPRLLDDLGRDALVTVDLTIRPDGSVGSVAWVSNLPPRVQRLLLGALVQWRFEPLPSERVHRIELAFNGE
jgi:hypothetical protein